MSRWKAAAIHLSISVAIGLIVGALLLLVWYPPPYFRAAGGDQLILLLVSVDVVLGPLLTLILFRAGKKGLKFDLSMIAVLQSSALVYGLSIVLVSRPVFLVGEIDRFVLVSASDIGAEDLAKGREPEFRSLSWLGPRLVAVELPPPGKARTDLMFASLGGKDVDKFPKYYVNYAQAVPELLSKAKPIEALPVMDRRSKDVLAKALQQIGRKSDTLMWLPITARRANLVMIVAKDDGAPLLALDINPWPN